MKIGFKLSKQPFNASDYQEMVKFCNQNKNLYIKDNEDDFEIAEIKEDDECEKFLNLPDEKKYNKSFLFSYLKYKFIDDNIDKGLDLTRPLIKVNNKIYSCDECLEKILKYSYDDEKNEKQESFINARKQAKYYIRTVLDTTKIQQKI